MYFFNSDLPVAISVCTFSVAICSIVRANLTFSLAICTIAIAICIFSKAIVILRVAAGAVPFQFVCSNLRRVLFQLLRNTCLCRKSTCDFLLMFLPLVQRPPSPEQISSG
jgi:hypothetical protein